MFVLSKYTSCEDKGENNSQGSLARGKFTGFPGNG